MSCYLPSLIITVAILILSKAYGAGKQQLAPTFISPVSPHRSRSPSPSAQSPSGIWSPWVPMTPSWPGANEQNSRGSPRSPLPNTLRIPNGFSAPTSRTSSRSITPNDTPLHTPTVLFHHEEEDDDTMLPPQYAVHREDRPVHSATSWPSGYDEEDRLDESVIIEENVTAVKREHGHKRKFSHFLPAPSNKPSGLKHWTYSWTFVFRGRRRRITIPLELPSLNSLREFATYMWHWRGIRMRRRGILWSLTADTITVGWPAALVWLFITRWMF